MESQRSDDKQRALQWRCAIEPTQFGKITNIAEARQHPFLQTLYPNRTFFILSPISWILIAHFFFFFITGEKISTDAVGVVAQRKIGALVMASEVCVWARV